MVVVETPKLKPQEKCLMLSREVNLHNPFTPQEEEEKEDFTFNFPREELIEEERQSDERNGESIMNSDIRASHELFNALKKASA